MQTKAHDLSEWLEESLRTEITLHKRYLEILEFERGQVVKFNAEKISESAALRELIYHEILSLQRERQSRVREVTKNPRIRLSEFIKTCLASECDHLLPLVEELKMAVNESQTNSKEFGQVLGFALNMVSSMVSMIWSAGQNIVKSYTKSGHVKESTYSQEGRSSGLLKKV